MPSVTKYANTISQTTGNIHVAFNNLNNLKNANATYAKTNKIGAKSATKKKPSVLFFTNFGFDIPEGADITSIVVEYAHQKLDYVSGKYPSIAAPEVTLLASGLDEILQISEGSTPTKTMTSKTVTWNGKKTVIVATTGGSTIISGNTTTSGMVNTTGTYNYEMPKRTNVNNANFGVKIAYPANTSANEGYIQLKYVRITVNYKEPQFSVKISRLNSSEEITVLEKHNFRIEVSNVNLTKYVPSFMISLPSDATISDISTSGISSTTGTEIAWMPFNNPVQGTWAIDFSLTFASAGSKTVSISESFTSTYAELTGIIVNPIPTDVSGSTDLVEKEKIIYAKQDTYFDAVLEIPKDYLLQEGIEYVFLFVNKEMEWSSNTLHPEGDYPIPLEAFDEDGKLTLTNLKTSNVGETLIYISTENTPPETPYFQIKCIPSNYTYPAMAIYKLSQEELNRLGDGYSYEVISTAVLATLSTDYVEDHYRNFRVGVVNSIAETNNAVTIFNACHSWSSFITTIVNTEVISTDFIYDEDYPVYIIFTGEYPQYTNSHLCNLGFTTPNIVEKDNVFIEEYCVFPTPILNLIEDESVADMDIDVFKSANSIKLYNFPFEDNFGTNDDYAIRGIEVEIECDSDVQVIANAVLKSNHGVAGQESIIISPGINIYRLGGAFDLWGFKISDMEELKKWEVELTFSNANAGALANLSITSCRVIAHYLKLDDGAKEKIYVEDENMEWYGAFIQDFKVIYGAKTDTKYLNVFGTDINDAYNMSIVAKEISLKFDVNSCSLEESSNLLNQITKLLTNKRDELNNPIPKRIWSSFKPDEYYEFILEDGINNEINITDYECEAKLTIPAGTSYKKEDTITNTSGIVNSIGKVNPYIILVPQAENIEILEEFSEQKFNMGYSGWSGMFVEIDCEHRIVWLRETEDSEPTNISAMVDFNSDWFLLDGAYNFIPTNCMIQTVAYAERGS